MAAKTPFWRHKALAEMTTEEWESLCDGCGKCCVHKLEDEDTGDLYYTEVACRLLDLHSCRCTAYSERQRRVPDCIALTPDNPAAFAWLPDSCAYRLVLQGEDLPAWHPLVTGDSASVHDAGRSVRGRVIAEDQAGDLEDHVLWLGWDD